MLQSDRNRKVHSSLKFFNQTKPFEISLIVFSRFYINDFFHVSRKKKQLSGKHERITLSFKRAELLNPARVLMAYMFLSLNVMFRTMCHSYSMYHSNQSDAQGGS